MDLPSGAILMCTSTSDIPAGWTILSSDYYTKPIKGFTSTYDNFSQTSPVAYAGATHSHSFTSPSVSGGVSHTHGTKTGITLSTSVTPVAALAGIPELKYQAAAATHSHTISIATANKTNSHTHALTLNVGGASTIPAHKTIVLIRKD